MTYGLSLKNIRKVFYLTLALILSTVLMFYGNQNVLALSIQEREALQTPFYDPGGSFDADNCSYFGSGGSGEAIVPSNFSLGSDRDTRPINLMLALMSDYGLSSQQAAGVVGNFMHESGAPYLPPNVNERLGISGDGEGPPRRVIPGTNTGGYGWAQWTGGRKINFIDFSIENGYMSSWEDEATDAANYAFLKFELNGVQSYTITELERETTVEGSVESFERTFERAGNPMLERRITLALQLHQDFLDSNVADGLFVGTCTPQGSAILGENAFPLFVKKSDIVNRSMFRDGTSSLGGHPYIAYDILVDPQTAVAAFMSGVVSSVSEDRCPGRLISVYNEENDVTVSYLHLSYTDHVQLGDSIAVGQRIGVVGSASQGCGVPHLHIDVATGSRRPGCSRLNCPPQNKSRFVDIGAELYNTFQLLED